MKKKILIVLSVIVILLVGIVLSINILNKEEYKEPIVDNQEEKENTDNSLDTEDENDNIFSDGSEKEDDTIVEEEPSVDDNTSNDPVVNENNNNTKPPIVETQPEVVQPPAVEKQPDPVPESEEPKEEIDYGYIEAMKEVEYLTEQECFDAGFEMSMNDAYNIIGFDVRELYYGGKIIGYKLILRYENPME